MLTAQEGADFLGTSRPTFVRILERGEVPTAMPGRHRYVRLRDLLGYKERTRTERRSALDEMVQAGQESGLHEATEGLPPALR